MYQIDFKSPVHVHFIGIGGISMSGLAQILLGAGFTVTGSDSLKSPLTKSLEERGARIFYGQRASNILDDTDLVVYTAAIKEDNPEFQCAVQKEIPMLSWAELLGQIMQNYGTAIAVAGTHGKTTTTSMISQILLQADADPTISVGGILPSIGGNIRVGASDLFVTEACEYTNSFLHFFPTMEVILNMDNDHLDFFHSIEEIRRSFRRFAELLPADGTLVLNADTPHFEEIRDGLPCHVLTYSIKKAPDASVDFIADQITTDKYGYPSFTVYRQETTDSSEGEPPARVKKKIGSFYLKVIGEHNVSNALAAIAISTCLGLSADTITRGLASFTGTNRRFEYKGKVGGVTIVDDYAHHPTEIKATLKAAKSVPHESVWCVFQPHTYTRTQALLPEFAEALSMADHVVLADIYAAREINTIGISSEDLQKEIQKAGCPCDYFPSFEQIEAFLLANCAPGDLVLTMGAGDVVKIGEHLLGQS